MFSAIFYTRKLNFTWIISVHLWIFTIHVCGDCDGGGYSDGHKKGYKLCCCILVCVWYQCALLSAHLARLSVLLYANNLVIILSKDSNNMQVQRFLFYFITLHPRNANMFNKYAEKIKKNIFKNKPTKSKMYIFSRLEGLSESRMWRELTNPLYSVGEVADWAFGLVSHDNFQRY